MALIPAIPQMTGNASPSGACTASSTYGGSACGGVMQPWNAFDRNNNKLWISNGTPTGWLQYSFSAPQTIVAYSVVGATVGIRPAIRSCS